MSSKRTNFRPLCKRRYRSPAPFEKKRAMHVRNPSSKSNKLILCPESPIRLMSGPLHTLAIEKQVILMTVSINCATHFLYTPIDSRACSQSRQPLQRKELKRIQLSSPIFLLSRLEGCSFSSRFGSSNSSPPQARMWLLSKSLSPTRKQLDQVCKIQSDARIDNSIDRIECHTGKSNHVRYVVRCDSYEFGDDILKLAHHT